ncbi:protein kinase domain-containing protein, partial [Xanthomonas euvesicatoria]
RMGENCQKPGRSVTKTGNSSTPITQMKPCNGCGLGVFQGRLMKMTLQGIHYMHSRNLLHRDIKPRNILKFDSPLGPVYKISDFGLAKNTDPAGESNLLTKIVLGWGTEKYMAPETQSAWDFSVKSDIFSMGVVFEDLNPSETPALRKIIDKCTHRRPNLRYDSAQAIYEDLVAIAV